LAARLGRQRRVSSPCDVGWSASQLLEIDVGSDQRDATGNEPACTHRLPGVDADDELRGAQQDVRTAGFAQLYAAEDGFGAIPAQAEGELVEADVEACLGAHEALERGSLAG